MPGHEQQIVERHPPYVVEVVRERVAAPHTEDVGGSGANDHLRRVLQVVGART